MQIDDADWATNEWAESLRATRALGMVLLIVLSAALIGALYLLLRIAR